MFLIGANAEDLRYRALVASRMDHVLMTLFTSWEVQNFMRATGTTRDTRMQHLLFRVVQRESSRHPTVQMVPATREPIFHHRHIPVEEPPCNREQCYSTAQHPLHTTRPPSDETLQKMVEGLTNMKNSTHIVKGPVDPVPGASQSTTSPEKTDDATQTSPGHLEVNVAKSFATQEVVVPLT